MWSRVHDDWGGVMGGGGRGGCAGARDKGVYHDVPPRYIANRVAPAPYDSGMCQGA